MHALNDVRSWWFRDPFSGIPLDDIYPLSARASSLLFRNKDTAPVLRTAFVHIHGAISVLKGLDHHQSHFVALLDQLRAEARMDLTAPLPFDPDELLHEAVAYINRIGQLYYFFGSKLVRERLGNVSIAAVNDLMAFRHKHTAHRSIDKPRPEDTDDFQTMQAMSLGGLGGMFLMPKVAGQAHALEERWHKCYVGWQIQTTDGVHMLVIERDHDGLMRQAYAVVQRLIAS